MSIDGSRFDFSFESRLLALECRERLVAREIGELGWKTIEAYLCHHIALTTMVRGHGLNALSAAEITGFPRETVRRTLIRLEECGFVSRDSAQAYVPGPVLNTLGVRILEESLRDVLELADEVRRIENLERDAPKRTLVDVVTA